MFLHDGSIGHKQVNPFMHNVEKWTNALQKICGVHKAIYLKFV